jgi:hypothetical protein
MAVGDIINLREPVRRIQLGEFAWIGSVESFELWLRSCSWLDSRLPNGWSTTKRVVGCGSRSEVVYEAVVPHEEKR